MFSVQRTEVTVGTAEPHLLHVARRTPPPLMTRPDTNSMEDPVSASDLYACGAFYWLLGYLAGLPELTGFLLRRVV